MSNPTTILALDVGDVRIGVARANSIARLPEPFGVIEMNDDAITTIYRLLAENDCSLLVVGLPRNMAGDETAQTAKVRAFAATLQAAGSVKIVFQDESLTSVKAEEALKSYPKKGYTTPSVDELAAVYILEDYLKTH